MKKIIISKRCECDKKYEWNGSPFPPRMITYKGNEVTTSVNMLCSPDITVNSFKCPKCGKEIWRADYKDKLTYQDNAEVYSEAMFMNEIREILRMEKAR